jgi:hypothetical protein
MYANPMARRSLPELDRQLAGIGTLSRSGMSDVMAAVGDKPTSAQERQTMLLTRCGPQPVENPAWQQGADLILAETVYRDHRAFCESGA